MTTEQQLANAINEAWAATYPGEPAVDDTTKLCLRVTLLAEDHREWVKNAKALQADNTRLRQTLAGLAKPMTQEKRDILEHAFSLARGCFYYGDSPAMRELVAAGYLRSLGKASWCPDEYFTITEAGIAWLRINEPKAQP